MAQYRLSSQVIGRSTGRSAVASAAYRSGQALADERTGLMHDFSRRGGVLHAEIMAPENAPEWMHDRARLWNAVEIAEKRGDAQLARELQLSLPHELDDTQRLELVRGFVQSQFVGRGMIADVCIHAPGKDGDDRNHHAHIMLTMREITGAGFGKKAREWNDTALLQTWREEWANHQNRSLERHGHPSKVDHRSFEAQGIDREATRHMGKTAHQMEQRGKRSRIGDENRTIEASNENRARTHQQAVVVSLDIERHRRQHEQATTAKVNALENAQKLADIDLDRRFHRERLELATVHAQQYGQHEAAIRAELAAIDERGNAGGWRKVLRNVTGAASRDRAQESLLRITLGDINTRRTEAERGLKARQDSERASIEAQRAQKVDRLKADMAKQGAKREKEITRELHRRQTQAQRDQRADAAAHRQTLSDKRRRHERTPEQRAKAMERKNRIDARKGGPMSDSDKDLMAEMAKILDAMPKRDFERTVKGPEKPAPVAPHTQQRVSHPAPAPSPMGELPRSPQKTMQNVPDKTPPKIDREGPAYARRDFGTKAPPEQPKPSTPVPERKQAALTSQWPRQTPETPAPEKVTPAQPVPAQASQTPATPNPAIQAPSLKDRWGAQAKADMEAAKLEPQRGRNKDFDRDR